MTSHPTNPAAGGGPAVPLTRVLDSLAADLATLPPPPLAPRVRRALRRAQRPAWRRMAWGFSGALACGVALVVSVLLLLGPGGMPPGGAPDLPLHQARLAPLDQAAGGSGFVPVASAERWQQLMHGEAAAAAWVVPSELPRERLAALGLPYDPGRAGDSVRAELLLHPSGELLAVRVMH